MSKKSDSLLSETAKQEKDMSDISEEIRELKELLEDELITQEEFDAKKSNY
ncbi:SHOCT domain-containing protein [Lysinibacillus parviboronicapiens]|uniref:SHOCT domain-containing protein n=1 Tax=Lysinibacillus parviboronicapiens TaxID=436516 RepID=UPI00187D5978|nr:SHOCT domain-containing protein [Lysinibacillus parviboronicapiens]